MKDKEGYQQELRARLNILKKDLEILKAKADRAEAGVKLEYLDKIADLEQKQKNANNKLAELKNASDEAWDDIKAGAETAWSNLGTAIKQASMRFK